VPFVVRGAEGFSAEERRLVGVFGADPDDAPGVSDPFCFEVSEGEPWPGLGARPPYGEAAEIVSAGGDLEIRHHEFVASTQLSRRQGSIARRTAAGFPLEISLRTAMCALLPGSGGVALHAAGLEIAGRGLVFFGPSGAGKTTLANASPFPVLSDELVAVTGRPWRLCSTGFWGEMSRDVGPMRQPLPLAALVELRKGDELRIEAMEKAAIVKQLVKVLVVPLETELWNTGLRVLGELAASIPVLRMSWSPETPPWGKLRALVDSAARYD